MFCSIANFSVHICSIFLLLFVLSLAHLFTHFVLSLQLALLVLHFHIFTWNVGIVGCKYFSVRVCVCVRVCNMNVYEKKWKKINLMEERKLNPLQEMFSHQQKKFTLLYGSS